MVGRRRHRFAAATRRNGQDEGTVLGLLRTSGEFTSRFVVWEGDEVAWVDSDGRMPSTVFYHWNGISNGGVGYASYNLAGDTIYAWEDGQIRTIAGEASEELHVEDVSPDGLIVGRFDGVWGVWGQDGVFRPWDETQVERCTQVAENRWVACVHDGDWFVAQIEEFSPTIPTIEGVLAFLEDAVEDGSIEGNGPGGSGDLRLAALGNMLEETRAMIEEGETLDEICGLLTQVLRRTDGSTPPPDFVGGPAAPDLADRVQLLMDELGCGTPTGLRPAMR